MSRALKTGLGIGVALIVGCVIAGLMVSRDGTNTKLLNETQDKFTEFHNLATWTNAEAEEFADLVVRVNDLGPAAFTYDAGSASLLIPIQPSWIDRLFRPGTKTYQNLLIRDFDNSFGKRWKAGLSARFGSNVLAAGRTPYFNPKFGRVTVSKRVHKAGSSNPLDYLDFALAP